MDSNEPHVIGSLIRTAAEWQIFAWLAVRKILPGCRRTNLEMARLARTINANLNYQL